MTESTTVVVATRDRVDSLMRCLDSLARLEHPGFDVVVVDSAPSDDSAEAAVGLGRWPFTLRYLHAEQPGLGHAHNTALAVVDAQVVAFTDDDVEVEPPWLAALGAPFSDPDVTCVTGLIRPAELRTPAQHWIEQAGGFGRGSQRREFSLRRPPDDVLFPFTAGRFGSGANMAFRTSWLVARGGFDDALGAGTPARGGDDLLAFLDAVLDGGVLVYEPAAVVRHWHRPDYASLRRQAFGYGVGLGAYLTAAVRRRPALLGTMLRRTAPAVRHLVNAGSAKNRGKQPGFPRELTVRERAGLLIGPLAYAASVRRYRSEVRA